MNKKSCYTYIGNSKNKYISSRIKAANDRTDDEFIYFLTMTYTITIDVPSVFRPCWLGARKSIQPVKICTTNLPRFFGKRMRDLE